MDIKNNPENFLYYVKKIKDHSESIKISWTKDAKNGIIPDHEDLVKENNENYIPRIYYFQKDENKKSLLLTSGSKTFTLILNNKNFIFDSEQISNDEMSLYEKFTFYKKFVEKLSSSSPTIKKIFYEDCLQLCLNKNINFLIFLDTLEYYKNEEKESDNLFKNLSTCSNFDNFNVETLKNQKTDYIELIEKFTKNKNLSLEGKNEDKGKLMTMIILYVCLSFENKFINYYNNNNKNKIDYFLNRIQIVEELFIENKIGKKIEETKKKEEVDYFIKWCKYCSNFIYLLSFFIKNPNKINIDFDFSKNYLKFSNEDNLKLMIQRYKEILKKIPSISKLKNIWKEYCKIYKSKKNLQNLLLLKDVIDDKKELIVSINEVIKNIFSQSKPSNLEICKLIQNNLTTNLEWMKGKIDLSFQNAFNLKDLSDEVIEEFKKCKLYELYGKEEYIMLQQALFIKTDNLKTLEKILKLFNFDCDKKNKREKEELDMIDTIIDEIGNKLKNYKQDDEETLFNIINVILNKGIGTTKIKKLITSIELNLPFNYLMDILSKILNEKIIKNEDINNEIINYLIDNSIKKNQIDILLTKITNKTYMKLILNKKDIKSQKFSIPTVQINHFLLDEDSKSIIILRRFIEDGQFENSEFIQNEGYGKEMAKLLEEIKKKFIDYDFTIDECSKILELSKKNILDSRLNLIFFKEEDKKKN